ncbi:MAG: hypothetical protein QG578_1508 [Thermodesulfobacteriota bacterium]|jgi:hypothetical protein|nr:hypothetical protein [Thermodesulfobacteriota bacterium]
MDILYTEIIYPEYFPDIKYPFGFHPVNLNKESLPEY